MFGLNKYISAKSSVLDSVLSYYQDCNCCGVCILSCPVWRQTRDVTLTLRGRVGAIKGGASPKDLEKSLVSCVLCGACKSVCPMGVDTVAMTIELRRALNIDGKSPLAGCLPSEDQVPYPEREHVQVPRGTGFFLPGRKLRSNSLLLNSVKKILEHEDICQARDDGSDIGESIEAGIPLTNERIRSFLLPLKGAKRLILAEGILKGYLRKWMPGVNITGLGLALLSRKDVRAALRDTDLYIIEARNYHGDYDNMVREYDIIRKETGCLMNVDLMRAAIPTGASGIQNPFGLGVVSPVEQVSWILEGRSFDRVVLESLYDLEPFQQIVKVPVIHVSELPGDEGKR